MQVNEKKGPGWNRAVVLGMAGLSLAALGTTSCAKRTAALHSTPFFSPTPTRQATNAVDAGDGDLEIAGLRRTMMSHPEDVEARLRLAQAYASRGFPDVALEHYRLAAERFPESASAAVRLARALRQAEQKEEALAGLQSFIHNHPQKIAEPYEWVGILNDDLQNWKASESAYGIALIYSPASAELHNNLGFALLQQYLPNSAAMEFRAALRLNRDLVIARNNLGIALAGNPDADRKEAILNWQAVSGPAAAHNNMAALLMERGDYRGARKELETALGYDQQNAQAIFNLALVSEKDGKPAVIPAQNAAARTPKPPSFLARFFHPGHHAAKPAGSQTSGATAERANVATASGSGN
jgi:Tfp pilus assembly protein PilF